MIKEKISLLISTCLGTGYFPKMPGTAGSVLSLMIYVILPESFFAGFWPNIIFLIFIISASLAVVPFINISEKILGHDSGIIVIDEFLAFLLAVLFLPKSLTTGLLAFVFFRIFDIFKPEPVNKLQSLPGGFGVMADDIMAGIYSNICMQIIYILVKI